MVDISAHLVRTYGVDVTRATEIEPGGSVFRVERGDGPTWVARVFPPERVVGCVEGDAEILRFLASHDFPAERCAHADPVSTLDGRGVLVTELVPGNHARHDTSTSTYRALGDLLGRLHSLPQGAGAVTRPAGGWHHLSVNGGGRRADVDALLPRLGPGSDALRDALESIDVGDGLPQALVHPDFGGPNAMVAASAEPVLIDWTGAGRGPRISCLNLLLAGHGNPDLVDAFVDGYAPHILLELAEIDRLPAILTVFSLILDAWMHVTWNKPARDVVAAHDALRGPAEGVAARVRRRVETG